MCMCVAANLLIQAKLIHDNSTHGRRYDIADHFGASQHAALKNKPFFFPRTMRYSMESALKLFLFVSLVTFSTVTLGHVVSPVDRSLKREDGRYPQIQFAKALGLDLKKKGF